MQCKGIDEYLKSVENIRGIIGRDSMKIAFFGRTSNGKSTTINALLHSEVLPSSCGHTTNCVVNITGCKEDEGYMFTSKSPNKQKVEVCSYAYCYKLIPHKTL